MRIWPFAPKATRDEIDEAWMMLREDWYADTDEGGIPHASLVSLVADTFKVRKESQIDHYLAVVAERMQIERIEGDDGHVWVVAASEPEADDDDEG